MSDIVDAKENPGCADTGCGLLFLALVIVFLLGMCSRNTAPIEKKPIPAKPRAPQKKYVPYESLPSETLDDTPKVTEPQDEIELRRAQDALANFVDNNPRPIVPERTVRVWVDNSGAHTIDAQVADVNFDSVTLTRADGSNVKIARSRLSAFDQRFIEERFTEYVTATRAWEIRREKLDQDVRSRESIVVKRLAEAESHQTPPIGEGEVKGVSTGFPEVQFLDDDAFAEIYAFNRASQLVNYWKQKKVSSTLTREQMISWGIEAVPVKTRVRVLQRFPIEGSFYYQVMPLTGKYQGWTLYVIQFDLYPSLR